MIKNYRITVEGISYDVQVEELGAAPGNAGGQGIVQTAPAAPSVAATSKAAPAIARAAPAPRAAAGDIASPLSGTIVKVHVANGAAVTAGQVLVTLEAMKMNTEVQAPADGTVTTVNVSEGDVVQEGQALVSMG